MSESEVLIVGAGPTGLAAGIDALRHGLSVRLIERRAERARASKALVVHARTMEVFETLGCTEAVLRAGQKFRALQVRPFQAQQPIRIDLLARPWGDTRYPYWLSVPQYDVERAMEECFLDLGGRIDWQTSLERLEPRENGVDVTLSTGRHQARWVLGCDGGRSATREGLGLELTRSGLGVTFALADVVTRSDLARDEGNGILSPDGLLLIVPMPPVRELETAGLHTWRLIAQVPADFDPSSLAAWSALVGSRAGVDLAMQGVGWNSRFDLTSGVVNHFRKGDVFLLGDAAHVHSPVGGQGLNTGVQDAHNLVWKLALSRAPGWTSAAREHLLDSYEAERRPIALEMVRVTGLATRVLAARNPLLRALRGLAANALVRTPLFQDRLARGVGMLNVRSAGSPRLENPQLHDGRRLHDVLDPLRPTLLFHRGVERLVRPDRIVARPGLFPESLARRVEVV